MQQNWDLLHDTVLSCLKEKLPAHLRYHHWHHTLHVMEMAEFIGREEGANDHEILLLKTAALFHDAGFIRLSKGHEEESVVLARKRLPEFGFSPAEIDIIAGLILATEIPQRPKTPLEGILADADLEYLGTDQFRPVGDLLFEELKYYRPELTREDWDDIQIAFLIQHHYHTAYCLKHRAAAKEAHLKVLLEEQRKRRQNPS